MCLERNVLGGDPHDEATPPRRLAQAHRVLLFQSSQCSVQGRVGRAVRGVRTHPFTCCVAGTWTTNALVVRF